MAVIGQINTIVSATTKPLQTGLTRASGILSSFGSKVGGSIAKIGGLATAFAGLAGAGGMLLMVKNSFGTIDALAKAADASGIATEKLAGLHRVSELAGVETEKFNKSLVRMQRSISDAASGSALAEDNFRMMGLSLDHIRSLSPDEQFIQVAEAIAKIPDQTDKVRLAMDTFGRDGAKVLALVAGGAETTREEIAKAAAMGLAPSREDARKIEAANDAISDMKFAFQGVANSIAISVAPTITAMATGIQAFSANARAAFEFIGPMAQQAFSVVGTVFSQAWETIKTVFDLIGLTSGTTFGGVRDSIINALIIAEFGIKNFGDVAALMWEKVKLGSLGFWEDTKHLFTVQIPEAVSWFGDNFREIMFTSIDYVLTVFQNLGKNIRSIWNATVDFFSGKGFNVDWTPLTEGFVSTIKELPNISERELTEVEKALGNKVKSMDADLGNRLAEFTEMRRAELLGTGEVAAETLAPQMPELGEQLAGDISEGIKGSVEGPAALQRGSADAFSAILSAQRNDKDPMADIAKSGAESVTIQKKTLSEIKSQNKNAPQLVMGDV